MKICIRIIGFLLILFPFIYCSRQKTYDERNIDRIEMQNTDNDLIQSTSIYEDNHFINKIPNNFSNIYSAYLSNSNYIIIDDLEYGSFKIYLDGNISPIGWSNKGHFAFAQFSYDIDNNPYSRIKIFNTVTDEIEDVVSNYNYFEHGYWIDEITFDEFWIKYNKAINALLKKNEINSSSDFKLWNIETLKERYDLEILLENGLPSYSVSGWGPPHAWLAKNIVIKDGKNKKKVIAKVSEISIGRKGAEEDEGDYTKLDFVGYYEYPYGDRIVFYFYDWRYYNGDNRVFLRDDVERLAGCNISIGFE
jgi:hypothetical protein